MQKGIGVRNTSRNRVIMIMIIFGAVSFTSIVGGPFSYAILYGVLMLPIASFLYMVYVFYRFKLFQTIDGSIMIKGQEVDYRYVLANEDYLHYKGLVINFLLDYSKVSVDNFEEKVSLLPREKHEGKGRLTCLYRGEYKVGIESVEVKDLLGLFSIKQGKPSTISARVYPQVIKLSSLAALSFDDDSKMLPFYFSNKNEIPDSESRLYVYGDASKTINWKISAKYNELFVRHYIDVPKEGTIIILDTSVISGDIGDKIVIEDALLEITLAISNYYVAKKMEAELLFYTNKMHHFQVRSKEDFNYFYDTTALMDFNGSVKVEDLIDDYLLGSDHFNTVIFVTALVSKDLIKSMVKVADKNSAIIYVGCCKEDELKRIRQQLNKTKLLWIQPSGDIRKVLEKDRV